MLRKILSLCALHCFLSAGCDEALQTDQAWGLESAGDSAEESATGPIVNQARDDISAIRAYPTFANLHPWALLDACFEVETLAGNLVRLDCTEAAENVIALSFPDAPGPLAHRFVVSAHRNDDGTYSAASSGLPCSLTRIETASRADALPFMDQVGFYFSGESRWQRSLALSDLDVAYTAMGHDDDLRVVHRFYAALPCWAGTASSSHNATYEFKPYMDFPSSNGTTYRNWDSVPNNYLLTGGAGATDFDRSLEVLKP